LECSQRAASVFRLEHVDRSVVSQERADHGKVAVPGGVVQCGLAVVEHGMGRPPASMQQFDDANVVAESRADNAAGGVGTESFKKRRVLPKDLFDASLVTDLGRPGETEPGGTALHEKPEDGGVAELVRDHARRPGQAETVDVDTASGPGIPLREVAFTQGGADRFGVVVENTTRRTPRWLRIVIAARTDPHNSPTEDETPWSSASNCQPELTDDEFRALDEESR
jgi:hypothetical protein